MLNKEVLLACANKQPKPHMVVTVDEQKLSNYTLRGDFGATLGEVPTPVWEDTITGENYYITLLVDWLDYKYSEPYVRTQLTLVGPPLALAFDSIQITRVDTAETFNLTLDRKRMEFHGVLMGQVFHDLKVGDTVGLIFDPPSGRLRINQFPVGTFFITSTDAPLPHRLRQFNPAINGSFHVALSRKRRGFFSVGRRQSVKARIHASAGPTTANG